MLTLTLPPETENQIRQNAAERGQDAERYLNDLIEKPCVRLCRP